MDTKEQPVPTSPVSDAALPSHCLNELAAYVRAVAAVLSKPDIPLGPLEKTLLAQLAAAPEITRHVSSEHNCRALDNMLLSPVTMTAACDELLAIWAVRELPISDILNCVRKLNSNPSLLPDITDRFAARLKEALLDAHEACVREAFVDALMRPSYPGSTQSRSNRRKNGRRRDTSGWEGIPPAERDAFWTPFRKWLPNWFGAEVGPLLKRFNKCRDDEPECRVYFAKLLEELIYCDAVPAYIHWRDVPDENLSARDNLDGFSSGHRDRFPLISTPILMPDEVLGRSEDLVEFYDRKVALRECAKALPPKQQTAWVLAMYPTIRQFGELDLFVEEICESIGNDARSRLEASCLANKDTLWGYHDTKVKRFRADFIAGFMGNTGTDGINTNVSRASEKVAACMRKQLGEGWYLR